MSIKLVPHLCYSPGASLCDFFVFPDIILPLVGKKCSPSKIAVDFVNDVFTGFDKTMAQKELNLFRPNL